MLKSKFNCDKCGICCTKLYLSHKYDNLNNGTGVCKYFVSKTNLCSIYNKRPIKCNIIAMYKKFHKVMSFDEYIKLNEEACRKLKEM